MNYPIDLIIFDCDGVLIDSEYLASKITAELITKAGHPITQQEISEKYSGVIMRDILKDLEKKSSHPFSATLIDQQIEEFKKRMVTELKIIPYVKETINNLNKNYCICSNSTNEDILNMLKFFNIQDNFKDNIFAAQDICPNKLKPNPDIFNYAAEKFNVEPQRCLVVEDSVTGIMGAKAANMRVVGFTGGSHNYRSLGNILTDSGAETVFSNFSELPLIINALEQWQDL